MEFIFLEDHTFCVLIVYIATSNNEMYITAVFTETKISVNLSFAGNFLGIFRECWYIFPYLRAQCVEMTFICFLFSYVSPQEDIMMYKVNNNTNSEE